MKPGIKTSEMWLMVCVIASLVLGAVCGKMDPNIAGALSAIIAVAYNYFRTDLKKQGVDDADIQVLPAAAAPAPSGSSVSVPIQTAAKALIVALGVMALLSGGVRNVMADSAPATPAAFWSLGQLQGWYPLQHVDAIPYLDSITTGDKMIGADTKLATFPAKQYGVIPPAFANLNVGAITSLKANGMPYASISLNIWEIKTLSGGSISYISLGYGHDFKINQDHFLIGTNISLW